jgi:O-antigen ligase
MYFPSAASESFSVFSLSAFVIVLVLLLLLIFRKDGHPAFLRCLVLLSITPLLLFFTVTSGLATLRMGALFQYAVLSVMLIATFRDIILPRWFGLLWGLVNIINLLGGFAIVAGFQPVGDFIVVHYSTAYDELVANMVTWHKPVLTFGTHSLAAFFLYLFFWLNLQGYKRKGQKRLLVLALCYILLTACLLSISAVVFVALGICQLMFLFWSSTTYKFVTAVGILLVLLIIITVAGSAFRWRDSVDAVQEILQDPGAGLAGRLLPGGTMYESFEYVKSHPFSPVGASIREGLVFGDDGPLEYVLRGSIPLLLLIYGGLFYFLRRNLLLKSDAYFLFAAIVIFEIGYTTLINIRALYLIPVFCAYLNTLATDQSPAPAISEAA